MSHDDRNETEEVGYCKPPAHSRYKKGQSGNPKGRPRGSRNSPVPYDGLLGKLVTIYEDGISRQVTRAEAFLLHLAKRILSKGGLAAPVLLEAFEVARAAHRPLELPALNIHLVSPGGVGESLKLLRMGRVLDQLRPGAQMMIEPWLVEAALARLGEQQLTLEQQAVVMRATRTPDKVKWPHWWTTREGW